MDCRFPERSQISPLTSSTPIQLTTLAALHAWVYYVEGFAGCRVHPIPGSWFRFPTQAFTHSGVCELVPNSSGKDRSLTCPSAGHPMSLCRSHSHSLPQHPAEVECAVHPKKKLTYAVLYPYLPCSITRSISRPFESSSVELFPSY